MTARFHTVTKTRDIDSPNVLATLDGSDPGLQKEYLVVSAHLDHLGIGPEVRGDRIYNGAIDNASGMAVMLAVAKGFASMPTKPKRSLLFIATTGEETGYVGSGYFAAYPTVSKKSLAANLNLDGDFMTWPLRDIVAYGAEHSTLQKAVEKAAERLRISVSPDPEPEQVLFIRSDQYSFVRNGIPAIFVHPGLKSDNVGIDPKALIARYWNENYHQPSDDMQQSGLNFDYARSFAQAVFLCGYYAADDDLSIRWNKGDFFGETFHRR